MINKVSSLRSMVRLCEESSQGQLCTLDMYQDFEGREVDSFETAGFVLWCREDSYIIQQ